MTTAIERLISELGKPDRKGMDWSSGEVFDPWALFPYLYGSYSEDFDEMAIEVLKELMDGTFKRRDLATKMFREMLCTSGYCDYGSSPRACFPTPEFREHLPNLITRWEAYAKEECS